MFRALCISLVALTMLAPLWGDENKDRERRVRVALALATAAGDGESSPSFLCRSDYEAVRDEALKSGLPVAVFVGTAECNDRGCTLSAGGICIPVKLDSYAGDGRGSTPRIVILSKSDEKTLFVRDVLPASATPAEIKAASEKAYQASPKPAEIDWFSAATSAAVRTIKRVPQDGWHTHQCANGHEWGHPDSSKNNLSEHTCPVCGLTDWNPKHHGSAIVEDVEQPEETADLDDDEGEPIAFFADCPPGKVCPPSAAPATSSRTRTFIRGGFPEHRTVTTSVPATATTKTVTVTQTPVIVTTSRGFERRERPVLSAVAGVIRHPLRPWLR